MMTRDEHYDDKTSMEECLKYLFSKVVSHLDLMQAKLFLFRARGPGPDFEVVLLSTRFTS